MASKELRTRKPPTRRSKAAGADFILHQIVSDREFSKGLKRALILHIQSIGIGRIIERFEAENGPLTEADYAEARRRLDEARRLARERSRRHR